MSNRVSGLKRQIQSNLKLQIISYAFTSLLLAMICFALLSGIFLAACKNMIEPARADFALTRGSEGFQEYVTEYKISSEDYSMIYGWTDGAVFSMPIGAGNGHGLQERNRDKWQEEKGQRGDVRGTSFEAMIDIVYSDRNVTTRFLYPSDSFSVFVGILLAGLISFALFFFCFYHRLKHKLDYISEVETGISILESGDLSHLVPVKGEDELGRLALSVNTMSESLSQRIHSEQQALLSGREIIGDLSHDIRTPLTILSGYIPLLLESEPLTGKQREYLELMNKKTGQMRKRVDELLDYATIYSGQAKFERVTLPAKALIAQLMEELVPFPAEVTDTVGKNTHIYADPAMLERVFDNLLSNLHKYADLNKPVRLCCREENEAMVLELENSILPTAPADGKEQGQKIMSYIMELHGGSFEAKPQGEVYITRISLPIRMERAL